MEQSLLRAEEPSKGSPGTVLPRTVPKPVFFSNWGRLPADLQHLTPPLWKLGLGKQASPSLTPPPTGPGGFLDKSQCVPTRLGLILPAHIPLARCASYCHITS